MPGHPGGIWCGDQVHPPPPQVLGSTAYVRADGGVLQRKIPQRERHDAGGTTVAHHIKCGGGLSGPPLGVTGNGNSRGGQQG